LYLTVEQVRDAASAWIEGQALPPSARPIVYRKVAERIGYYQHRNRQARQSHTKKTLSRLRNLGIEVGHLKSCVPDDL
jgi:hypothetical protein